jgi:hypothetical protein
MTLFILVFSCSSPNKSSDDLSNVYLFGKVFIKPEKKELWEKGSREIVNLLSEKNYPYAHLVYRIDDTTFYTITGLNEHAEIGLKITDLLGFDPDNKHIIEQQKAIRYSHSGILIEMPQWSTNDFSNIRQNGNYALFESCYIKTDKTKVLEDNWVKWKLLHDSLQTNLNYIEFVGTFGFENPFYFAFAYSKDSLSMKASFNKLFQEGGSIASKLYDIEMPHYYRKFETEHGYIIPEFSYWP